MGPSRHPSRRVLVSGLLAFACAWFAACAAQPASEGPERPNILLILTDQWRGMALGVAGDPNARTPHLDRLASEGVWFENAFANSPICTPSRAQLLTGRYPYATGVILNDLAIRTDETSIAHVLNGAGYRSGWIGKWHLDGLPREKFTPPGPRRMGFDDYWAVSNCEHDYFAASYYTDTPEPIAVEGYEPEVQTELALDYMRGVVAEDPERPFFLTLSWGPPHFPYHLVPQEWRDRFDPDELEPRPNATIVDERVRGGEVDRRDAADYYAACAALDELVGRLMEGLSELGIAEDTLVVFTSDHGDMLGSQGIGGKDLPFDEATSIPMILRWPAAIPAGHRPATLFSMADLMPTLLGLAGADVPDVVQGSDLAAWARGRGEGGPASVYLLESIGIAMGRTSWRAVRTREHLYAEDIEGPWLLFDVEADPYQEHNLAADPESREVRERLATELRGWYERLGEEYLDALPLAERVGRQQEVLEILSRPLPSRDDGE